MNDVIWAAAIAGGVGVAGNVTAVLVSRHAGRQERVRLMEERRDSERTYRRESYEQLGWMLARLHKYAVTGYAPSADDWKDWLDHYAYWSGVVAIIGGSDVVAAAKSLGRVIDDLGETLAEAALAGDWRDAYRPHAQRVETARDALDRAMGADLNRLASFEAAADLQPDHRAASHPGAPADSHPPEPSRGPTSTRPTGF